MLSAEVDRICTVLELKRQFIKTLTATRYFRELNQHTGMSEFSTDENDIVFCLLDRVHQHTEASGPPASHDDSRDSFSLPSCLSDEGWTPRRILDNLERLQRIRGGDEDDIGNGQI